MIRWHVSRTGARFAMLEVPSNGVAVFGTVHWFGPGCLILIHGSAIHGPYATALEVCRALAALAPERR